MEQVVKDLVQGFKERVSNPILFAYGISFVIYNFKSIAIFVYSTECVTCTLDLIEKDYFNGATAMFGIPLVSALIYSVVMPYLGWGIDFLTFKAVKKRKRNALELTEIELKKSESEKAIEENKISIGEAKNTLLKADKANFERLNISFDKALFDEFMEGIYSRREVDEEVWQRVIKVREWSFLFNSDSVQNEYKNFMEGFVGFLDALEDSSLQKINQGVLSRVMHFEDAPSDIFSKDREKDIHKKNFYKFWNTAKLELDEVKGV